MSSKENPVFVVGVFRSGTSLLRSILNQNPEIALMYECDVWNFPKPLLKSRFKLNWAGRVEFYNRALSRHRMISQDQPSRLEKIRTPMELYRAFGQQKDASVHGEKSPFYCDRLEQLHQQYPAASFILIWRNPVEVYRSVLKAGQISRFFGRPGMLSRMIYLQEQAIGQAARIEEKGARIFRVNYSDVVDQTETVCRSLCRFLGVPFDPLMLQLKKADLTAMDHDPIHTHLQRGIIERQTYTEKLVPPRIAAKLRRYRDRWEQQQANWLKAPVSANPSGPRPVEFVYHNALGKALITYDALVRASFEFLPLPWLNGYRRLKSRAVNPRPNTAAAMALPVWEENVQPPVAQTASQVRIPARPVSGRVA